MFAYLSKKISIPDNHKVKCVCWSWEQGFIAVGGENGLVKVVRIEGDGSQVKNFLNPKNLQTNQNLEGHVGTVNLCQWNEVFHKLTTCDNKGLIIVWVSSVKTGWFEEMVNNRNADTPVTGLSWSPDGLMVAILYEDGTLIVGSVEGTRVWSANHKGAVRCLHVQWSPDSHLLLVGVYSQTHEIYVYDNSGSFLHKVPLTSTSGSTLVSIQWCSYRHHSEEVPSLAIAFEGGRIHLLKHDSDNHPLTFTADMKVTCCQWNYTGTILAVGCRNERDPKNVFVKFYSPKGDLIQVLKLPGKDIASMSWEREGLRMVLGVDSSIYFANIRPRYRWTFFADTVVFPLAPHVTSASMGSDPMMATPSNALTTRGGDDPLECILFWNLKNKRRHQKQLAPLLDVTSFDQLCVLAIKGKDSHSLSSTHSSSSSSKGKPMSSASPLTSSTLIICNNIGTPTDSLPIEIKVVSLFMNGTFIIAGGGNTFLVWRYDKSPSGGGGKESGDPISTHTRSSISMSRGDITHRRSSTIDDDLSNADDGHFERIRIISMTKGDEIHCITGSHKLVLISCSNGRISAFHLPSCTPLFQLEMSTTSTLSSSPSPYASCLYLSPDMSLLAIIDSSSVLSFYKVSPLQDQVKLVDSFADKKDVWHFSFSSDGTSGSNGASCCFIERNKLVLMKDFEVDETTYSTGFIYSYQNLEVRTIDLDQLVNQQPPSDVSSIDSFISVKQTKLLKDLMSALAISSSDQVSGGDRDGKEIKGDASPSFDKAIALIQENSSHPQLWNLLSEYALKSLDFTSAELGFVRSKDWKGIHFCKKVSSLQGRSLQEAEVDSFLGHFDAAQERYLQMDRPDLALNLRRLMGHSLKIIKLIESGLIGSLSDQQIDLLYQEAGDYFAERLEWKRALYFYAKCRNVQHQFECLLALEDFDGMKRLKTQGESDILLHRMGRVFESVGMCDEAVDCFIRSGQVQSAIDCCVSLNEWKLALTLAQQYDVHDIDPLLAQYATHLMDKGNNLDIVELYRKANRVKDAAIALNRIIQERKMSNCPPIQMKQLHCLNGLLFTESAIRKMNQSPSPMGPSRPLTSSIVNRSAVPKDSGRMKSLSSLLHDDLDLDMSDLTSSVGPRKKSMSTGPMVQEAGISLKWMDQPWRGCEAYHLFLLSHRQLFQGKVEESMKTSLHLRDYEEFLTPKQIYSLMALTSLANRNFSICSRAFIKLESLEESAVPMSTTSSINSSSTGIKSASSSNDPTAGSMSTSGNKEFSQLSVNIFMSNVPKEGRSSVKVSCPECESLMADYVSHCPACNCKFPICMASGKPILDTRSAWSCNRCLHCALRHEMLHFSNCPLCHYPVDSSSPSS